MPRGAVGRGIVTKRITANYTVAEEIDQVLADAAAAAITVTLVPRGGHSERKVKVQNVGDGSFAVTVASTGSATINGTTSLAAAGSAATYELDDLGNWHVFGDSSGGTTGDIDGGGTAGTLAMFTAPTTVGDSVFNQSSGVGSIGDDFGVEALSGRIIEYGNAAPTNGELLIGDTGNGFSVGNLASADGSVVVTPGGGTIDLSAPPAGITATDATNTLELAVDVAEAETVTIGADVYEIEIVNTDSTDNTANSDFVPLTDPLVVAGADASYPGVFAQVVGDLVRIGTEIMRITVKTATDLTFQRGVSGTTIATHADAEDIFIGDGIAGGSTVAVGLVATLTPAAFAPALIDDTNSEGTEPFTASASGNDVVITADTAGSAGNNIVCAESLVGVGNQWISAVTFGGANASSNPVAYEIPAGVVDGANDAFIFSAPPILVFRNGVMEIRLGTVSVNTFTFTSPPDIGDNIEGLV